MQGRRINLFAGACAGKSTVASYLYSELNKSNEISVELVHEYVKKWTYIDRKPQGFDQVVILGNQLSSEELPLRSCDLIITDSPLMLGCCYAKHYESRCWQMLTEISKEFEKEYGSINIFLNRDDIPFEESGRFGGLDFSLEIDEKIRKFLRDNGITFVEYSSKDREGILNYIKKELEL